MNRRAGDVLLLVALLAVAAAVALLTVLRVRSIGRDGWIPPDVGERAPHGAPSDGAPPTAD